MSVEQLPVLPTDQWFTERKGYIELNHPFGEKSFLDGEYNPTPMRGFDYDGTATEPPEEFESARDADWRDGIQTWEASIERAGGRLDVIVWLTDPARPDGLGDIEALKRHIGESGLIGHTALRSVWHSIKQHGRYSSQGVVLSDTAPHPEYQGILEQMLLDGGTPTYCFDPSAETNEPVSAFFNAVQAVRNATHQRAQYEKDMAVPTVDFFAHDLVQTSTTQWMQLGISGVMADDITEQNYGNFPEKKLLILPVEQAALAYKIATISQNYNVEAEFAFPELRLPGYTRDQYTQPYADNLQEGNIEL